MPAASASASRSLPSYQAPDVGRATEGMTATVASFRTASRMSLTREVTTAHRQSRKAFRSPSVRVSASQKASAISAGKSTSLPRYPAMSSATLALRRVALMPAAFAPLRQCEQKHRPN